MALFIGVLPVGTACFPFDYQYPIFHCKRDVKMILAKPIFSEWKKMHEEVVY